MAEGSAPVVDSGPAVAAFAVAGATSEPASLTWGQRAIWQAIRRTAPGDQYFNMTRVLSLAGRGRPVDVEGVTAALGLLMERHQALRTRLVAEEPEPRQVRHTSGMLAVEVFHSTLVEDCGLAADALAERLGADRFDYFHAWPLRAGLIVHAGRVTHVALALCHVATDGHGLEVLVRDLRLLIRRGSAGRPVTSGPLDLAHEQASPLGLRRGGAALAHWETHYRRIAPTVFAEPVIVAGGRGANAACGDGAEAAEPRFRTVRLVSTALARAADAVALAHRISPSAVLLAGAATLTARAGGHDTAVVLPIVANRFRADSRDLVSTLSQEGLFVLDLDREATFTESLPAAWQAALRSYRSAGYDPDRWNDLMARIADERGTPIKPFCCFNDMRLVDRPPAPGPPPSAADLDAARADSRVEPAGGHEFIACRYCMHVVGAGDALSVTVTGDTAYLPVTALEAHLLALEDLVVRAATDRELPIGALSGFVERVG
ncbi:condensation domain-containing protein [Streptomyces sp. SID3343]|uniref:condensation domain-containing protein n=1 Tax=Streptomyces sp. SID3343 TaxID=2690260 RepID=UPI00137003FF|nr:condensation domain-containing protein [Streptomyces sp. SID3343]MYW05502.1 non-ribosomal peptide synthetase condensation domain protein [Streptomyces sp. SID3343]